MKLQTMVQGSLFEEDYLYRTLGALVHSPDVALTELVANAWDAGASEVNITIPDQHGEMLIVEDDGTGLTKDLFHGRWMKLGYNRVKHQGKKVEFPPGRNGNRLAYGRNGVGRHGLLCFAEEYTVTTRREGTQFFFKITTQNEQSPFVISDEREVPSKQGHGTRLEVVVRRNLPRTDRILDVLSARFMHDPAFSVKINGKSIPLEEHKGLIDKKMAKVGDIALTMYFIDSTAAARKTLYQGIAFWQGGRLVGEPSWVLGQESVIDGRTRFAKRYTVVVTSDDLADLINNDWTGFRKDEKVNPVFDAVRNYVEEEFAKLASEQLYLIKDEVHKEFAMDIASLTPLGRYEVDEAIQLVTENHPTARPETMSIAIDVVINMERSRSGRELLKKLADFSEEDIEGLNRLLSQWTVKDALCVLDEIDRRISTIEAIRKLSGDTKIDELHVLHPLITEARWLFGPEFDSPEYVSNRQLQTAARELFKVADGKDLFLNPKKRPDLIVLDQHSISLTGIASMDSEKGLATTTRILLIEIKRGGFELTRTERNQIQGYVEDLLGSGIIGGNPFVNAFLVGMRAEKGGISGIKVTDHNEDKKEIGRVTVATFAQLVDTAEQRLFSLRETLRQRYDDIPGIDLFRKVVQEDLFSPSGKG